MSNSKIELLKQTIQEDPNNPFAYFALARENLKLNNRDEARHYYEHLICRFPEYGGTYYHFAIYLLEENEIQTALDIIDQGIETLRRNHEHHLLSELRTLRLQVDEG